jgi:hypothetical protein
MAGRDDHNIYNPLPSFDQVEMDRASLERVQDEYAPSPNHPKRDLNDS